jgi:hypothetical protein
MENERTYTAFAGTRLVASGALRETLLRTKQFIDRSGAEQTVLIFDDQTGRQAEFDFRGTLDEVLEREAPSPRTGPGRPKLGVVSREVSLLPRHWDWLEHQPSGISAALRRLVEEAIKRDPAKERARRAREAVSNMMTVLAGDLPNFEEASRALFACDPKRFARLIHAWPKDVRKHIEQLAQNAFGAEPA